MSFGNTFENDLAKLIFQATAIANIADNASAAPLTSLYASLHTGDPGEAGDQTTNECAYTSYARVAITRSAVGWTVTANSVSPAANVVFPTATGGTETATHVAIGTAASGAGKVLVKGALSASINIVTDAIPTIATGSTITLD